MKVRDSMLPAHLWMPEPGLQFHPDRSDARSEHPLLGLISHGPYSQSLINKVLDPIRVAVIAPEGEARVVDGLLSELERTYRPQERHTYLPNFPSFSKVFGLRVVKASTDVQLEIPRKVDAQIVSSPSPHLLLAQKLTEAIAVIQTYRSEFDVLLIYLPDKWQSGFYGGDGEDFDLHDYLKAMTASCGIPTQIILEEKALLYPCRCSVMWRLGIALYCKAGGVPWKLADATPDTAFIGLSYAIRPNDSGQPRFVTCCSQVFDSDGAGLEFIAYDTDDVRIERDNPFLSRSEMRRVMARSLAIYQRRHTGRLPKRVVVHKSTEFKNEEIDGCFDAWQGVEGLELIQVQQDVFWRGIQIDPPRGRENKKGTPARYPCRRGSFLPLGGKDVLLWTQGNTPTVVGGKDFYKEGKSIPSPLLITRYAGHGGWEECCRQLLGLTKMNWNNDGLYDRLPVTLGYAKTLARTIKRMPQIASRPYEFRLFM